ncbi:MAG: flagellar motor switch protein FliM, partial [Pseudomonadota bacterium]
MVNAASQVSPAASRDRRDRARAPEAIPASLGNANLNPFGDLHTLQHLTARLARALRPVFDQLLRGECRIWAEPLVVQRFADYRAERGDAVAAWLALPNGAEAPAQLVIDARFVLELLDIFFGGSGTHTATAPTELTPAADAMVVRLGAMIVPVLTTVWEPVARVDFAVGAVEANPATLAGVDPDDALGIWDFDNTAV